MQKEIVQTGKTVEEAIDNACLRLGIRREDCEWEIIDLPKTAFFGLKKIPAKVRVWIEVPDEPIVEQEKEIPKKQPDTPLSKPEKKGVAAKENKESSAKPVPKPETPPNVQEKIVKQTEDSVESSSEKGELTPLDMEKAQLAKDYVTEIMRNMGVEGVAEIRPEYEGVCIAIYGKNLGALIGRRGDTLHAIQYLTGLVANRLEGEYLRVTVDCGDYQLKRIQSLEEAAVKAGEQVKATNISKTMEPMSAAERRIVHAKISEMEGVSSSSIGKEPYRRVVIKTPTSKMKKDTKPRKAQDNARPKRKPTTAPRKNDEERPSVPSEPIPKQKAEELPLYGKIELE